MRANPSEVETRALGNGMHVFIAPAGEIHENVPVARQR
jgi:hypothetical protein